MRQINLWTNAGKMHESACFVWALVCIIYRKVCLTFSIKWTIIRQFCWFTYLLWYAIGFSWHDSQLLKNIPLSNVSQTFQIKKAKSTMQELFWPQKCDPSLSCTSIASPLPQESLYNTISVAVIMIILSTVIFLVHGRLHYHP